MASVLTLSVMLLTLWPLVVPLVPHVKRFLAARDRGDASASG